MESKSFSQKWTSLHAISNTVNTALSTQYIKLTQHYI